MKYRVGDKVIITGELYYSSNDTKPSGYVKDKKTTITRIAVGTRHPYNSTGDLGWCDESSIRYQDEPIIKKEVECTLVDKDNLIGYIEEHPNDYLFINGEQLKEIFKNASTSKNV